MNIKEAILSRLERIKTYPIKSDETPGNWHEDFIVHIARVARPKVYVELGLYQSELFNKMIPYAGELYGVDRDRTLEKYMHRSEKSHFFAGTTDDFAMYVKKNKIRIDILFIDADHSARSVEKDFINFFPFVSPQGLILLHDAYPKSKKYVDPGYCGDGYKTIWNLSQKRRDFELVTIPVHPGLAICRKRNKQLEWQ